MQSQSTPAGEPTCLFHLPLKKDFQSKPIDVSIPHVPQQDYRRKTGTEIIGLTTDDLSRPTFGDSSAVVQCG